MANLYWNRHSASLEERLLRGSEMQPNGCRVWIRSHKNTYPSIWWKGKTLTGHRLTWELAHGVIPKGMHVCHRCDNTMCINLEHLFLGTAADNMADKMTKGRANFVVGERHYAAKLTPEKVRAIRASTLSQSQIAREMGISQSVVCEVRTRKAWKEVH